jgi:uncharacterized membrane protein YjgN (DUF898 family)
VSEERTREGGAVEAQEAPEAPVRAQPTVQEITREVLGPESASDMVNEYSVEFKGTARGYFRVWIVNLCLTLLTFGIYSAWAKVRKQRYLYSHTLLAGTPFQYLGRPIPILKGRIVAAVFAALWYFCTHFMLELWPVLVLVAAFGVPWVMLRSAAFRARMSAYRNITFHFSGHYWEFWLLLLGWTLVTVITFGIGWAWLHQRVTRYMVTHTSYGGVSATFRALGGEYFSRYLIAGIIAAVGGAAVAGLGALEPESMIKFLPVLIVASYVVSGVTFTYLRAQFTNLLYNRMTLGDVEFASTVSTWGLLRLYLTNALGVLVSAGLLIPWAVVRTAKYRAANLVVALPDDLRRFEGTTDDTVQAVGSEMGEFFDLDFSL